MERRIGKQKMILSKVALFYCSNSSEKKLERGGGGGRKMPILPSMSHWKVNFVYSCERLIEHHFIFVHDI